MREGHSDTHEHNLKQMNRNIINIGIHNKFLYIEKIVINYCLKLDNDVRQFRVNRLNDFFLNNTL